MEGIRLSLWHDSGHSEAGAGIFRRIFRRGCYAPHPLDSRSVRSPFQQVRSGGGSLSGAQRLARLVTRRAGSVHRNPASRQSDSTLTCSPMGRFSCELCQPARRARPARDAAGKDLLQAVQSSVAKKYAAAAGGDIRRAF